MTNAQLYLSTNDFIAGIKAVASRFDTASYPQQNLPADDWTLLTRAGVLLPTLPREYGGRDSHVEMCRVVEAISEYNLPLGMYVTVITGSRCGPSRCGRVTRRSARSCRSTRAAIPWSPGSPRPSPAAARPCPA